MTGSINATVRIVPTMVGTYGIQASTTAIKKLVLGNFNSAQKLVDPTTGNGTAVFVRFLNDAIQNIVSALNADSSQIVDITNALNQAGIAIATADAAAASANAAAAAATAATADAALTNSYVSPANILTAEIDPADATKAAIIVANHTRYYGDGTSVAVDGATISGLALSTLYYVVYQDASRAGGAVVYQTTTSVSAAGQSGAQHLVGSITTPASGATVPTSGGVVSPPGVGSIGRNEEEK